MRPWTAASSSCVAASSPSRARSPPSRRRRRPVRGPDPAGRLAGVRTQPHGATGAARVARLRHREAAVRAAVRRDPPEGRRRVRIRRRRAALDRVRAPPRPADRAALRRSQLRGLLQLSGDRDRRRTSLAGGGRRIERRRHRWGRCAAHRHLRGARRGRQGVPGGHVSDGGDRGPRPRRRAGRAGPHARADVRCDDLRLHGHRRRTPADVRPSPRTRPLLGEPRGRRRQPRHRHVLHVPHEPDHASDDVHAGLAVERRARRASRVAALGPACPRCPLVGLPPRLASDGRHGLGERRLRGDAGASGLVDRGADLGCGCRAQSLLRERACPTSTPCSWRRGVTARACPGATCRRRPRRARSRASPRW